MERAQPSWFHDSIIVGCMGCLHGIPQFCVKQQKFMISQLCGQQGCRGPSSWPAHDHLLTVYSHDLSSGCKKKVSSLLSPGVSSLLRSLVWVSLNCPDLGTDEGVGTVLLTLHLDSTQIKQGSWRLFIYFLCRNTMINYPKFHCQTLSLLPVVKASALWLMLCFGCWVPSKGPRIERCAFLGWWCRENLRTMVGLSGASLGHGLEDSCGILVSSWLKTQCVALSHTVTMIGHLFRAPWTLSCTWRCSIVTYINLFLLDKYIVSGISP